MRKLILLITITAALGLGGAVVYKSILTKNVTHITFRQSPSINEEIDTSKLIEEVLTPPVGQRVTPLNKAEIEKIYRGINMIQIPRIFIDRLPNDFTIESTEDKTLFMKIVTALMLQTNEKILKERRVIQILNDKLTRGIPWTPRETDFFNKMVDKYDAVLAKTIQSKMADLMVKIDIIPVSIGVAQAILFSKWGTVNKSSIYGEYGWIDKEHYEPLPFSSLIQATDSYALALNSRSQLVGFREARKWMRPYINQRSLGWDLAHNLNNYREDEEQYGEQISQIYGQGLIKELDHACFDGECTFEP